MYIQESPVDLSPLSDKNSNTRQHDNTEESGVDKELDEVFEACFGDDTADPGAEMVHFEDAAVHFAAVMGAIGFMV